MCPGVPRNGTNASRRLHRRWTRGPLWTHQKCSPSEKKFFPCPRLAGCVGIGVGWSKYLGVRFTQRNRWRHAVAWVETHRLAARSTAEDLTEAMRLSYAHQGCRAGDGVLGSSGFRGDKKKEGKQGSLGRKPKERPSSAAAKGFGRPRQKPRFILRFSTRSAQLVSFLLAISRQKRSANLSTRDCWSARLVRSSSDGSALTIELTGATVLRGYCKTTRSSLVGDVALGDQFDQNHDIGRERRVTRSSKPGQ